MNSLQQEVLIPVDVSKLAECRQYLYDLCDEQGIPRFTTRRMILAVDEALSNVIQHGNVPPGDKIGLRLDIGEDQIVVEIRDTGIRFDPNPAYTSPVEREAKSYPRRGFGLFLIHLIVDDLSYTRTPEGKNVLTLKKSIK